MRLLRLLTPPLAALLLAGCASKPMATVANVDLPRFMGDWYVIANIPTWIERDARDAVESYRLAPDGTIETTFTYRGPGDEPKRLTARARVLDRASNALWGMQFVWPFEADYRIIQLAPDYSHTVIGREKRDYVWIMARAPALPEAVYAGILRELSTQGYDTSLVRKVPQRPGGRS